MKTDGYDCVMIPGLSIIILIFWKMHYFGGLISFYRRVFWNFSRLGDVVPLTLPPLNPSPWVYPFYFNLLQPKLYKVNDNVDLMHAGASSVVNGAMKSPAICGRRFGTKPLLVTDSHISVCCKFVLHIKKSQSHRRIDWLLYSRRRLMGSLRYREKLIPITDWY